MTTGLLTVVLPNLQMMLPAEKSARIESSLAAPAPAEGVTATRAAELRTVERVLDNPKTTTTGRSDTPSDSEESPVSEPIPQFPVQSTDPRYVRFVAAVQALRLDPDATTLTKRQIAALMEAAKDIFLIDDGVPKQVRPVSSDPETTPAAPEVQTLSDTDHEAA